MTSRERYSYKKYSLSLLSLSLSDHFCYYNLPRQYFLRINIVVIVLNNLRYHHYHNQSYRQHHPRRHDHLPLHGHHIHPNQHLIMDVHYSRLLKHPIGFLKL